MLRLAIYSTLLAAVTGLYKQLDFKTLNEYTGSNMAVFVRFKVTHADETNDLDANEFKRLGKYFKKSKRVLIGELDCASLGDVDICKYVQKEHPYMFWQPDQKRGNIYGGDDMDFETLKTFAHDQLGPPCSPKHRWRCDAGEGAFLDQLLDLDLKNLTTTFEMGKKELLEAQATSTAALEEARGRIEPGLKLVKAVKDHMAGLDKSDGEDIWKAEVEPGFGAGKTKAAEPKFEDTRQSSIDGKEELR